MDQGPTQCGHQLHVTGVSLKQSWFWMTFYTMSSMTGHHKNVISYKATQLVTFSNNKNKTPTLLYPIYRRKKQHNQGTPTLFKQFSFCQFLMIFELVRNFPPPTPAGKPAVVVPKTRKWNFAPKETPRPTRWSQKPLLHGFHNPYQRLKMHGFHWGEIAPYS